MTPTRIASSVAGSLAVIGAGVLASLVVALAIDAAWGLALLALVFGSALAHHLRQAYVLGLWLEAGEPAEAPRTSGLWDELHALLHRSRREAARREASLAHSLNRWRAAARALPDGVILLEDDRIEWCNDTARVHLDLDPARDSGTAITHLIRSPVFTG